MTDRKRGVNKEVPWMELAPVQENIFVKYERERQPRNGACYTQEHTIEPGQTGDTMSSHGMQITRALLFVLQPLRLEQLSSRSDTGNILVAMH